MAVVLSLQARQESERAVAARDFMTDIFLQADQDRTVVETMQDQPLLQTELLLGIGDALDFTEDLCPADQALQQAAQVY